jgi:hypothetical protein
MINSRRQIFRESALQEYVQRQERDVLPNIVSPPVFACSWFLLALVLTGDLLAWSARIPTYISASGVVTSTSSKASSAQALVFFPTADAAELRAGLPITLQLGSSGPSISSTITQVVAGTVSPSDARKTYALDAGEAEVITEPSKVVIVSLDKSVSASAYAGTTVSAKVQVGTHSVLSEIS